MHTLNLQGIDALLALNSTDFDGIIMLRQPPTFSTYPMTKQRTIERTYTKVNLKDMKSDFEYWQTQPAEMRLATLEQIRFEYHAWKHDSQPRLQRVFSIIKLK